MKWMSPITGNFTPSWVLTSWLLTSWLLTSWLLTSCSQDRIDNFGHLINGKRHAPEIVSVVEGRNGDSTLLKIYLDLNDSGLTIRIYNIPSEAELFCEIDDRAAAPCRHGDRFARPAPGEHMVTATARRNGKILDSAIAKFTVGSDADGAHENTTIGSGDRVHPLALTALTSTSPQSSTLQNFTNGSAIHISRTFTVNFAFPQTPPCENPQIRCAMDSSSGIWSLCDTKQRRRVIPPALLANGSQSLYAQASCGDLSGPLLHVQWYGVPDNYQPLMAQVDRDESEQRLISLVREPDCAASGVIALMWECRVKQSVSSWEACASGGRLASNLVNRYDAVRGVCGTLRGPPSII